MINFFISIYIQFKFKRLNRSSENETIKIFFSRGTFSHDIPHFNNCDKNGLIFDALLLRRAIRLIVPDLCLEQIISQSHKSLIRRKAHKIVSTFVNEVTKLSRFKRVEIIFGGVDYFEVALFCNREDYQDNVKFISYFHENYTIGYVKNVSKKIYDDMPEIFEFDELYVYGQPAGDILGRFTRNLSGPIPEKMPRLLAIKSKFACSKPVARTGVVKVLYLAFPGSEYLAPLTFTSILLLLSKMSNSSSVTVKFKNKKQVKHFEKRLSFLKNNIHLVGTGSVGDYLIDNEIVVVFNSLSFYESLLSDALIIIPCFSDTNHDPNILQESQDSINEVYEFKTIVYAKNENEIETYINNFCRTKFENDLNNEKEYREKLLTRKFYL